MRKLVFLAILSLAGLFIAAPSAAAQNTPRLFFTDLVSGPNSGGQNNNGVFLTIWGRGFGATQGSSTVTVGGGTVSSYPVWTANKVTVQLGAAAKTGNVILTVAGVASNGLPFTVRTGRILFVATSGSDTTGDGSFAKPWRSVIKAHTSEQAGDTIYMMDGYTATADAGWGCALCLDTAGGTAAAPIAYVAYPGAKVTIGIATQDIEGIGTPNIGQSASHYVFSQLKTIGGGVDGFAIAVGAQDNGKPSTPKSNDYRIIGNELTCPNVIGNFQGGCGFGSLADNIKFLGNYVHDVAKNDPSGSTKGYHNVYFTTDSNHVEVAWNEVDGTFHSGTNSGNACRGVQFHSSPVNGGGANDPTGHDQFDIHVHDNYIHDTHCDGINFATVDPSQGPVEAYNNLIVRAGTGVMTGDVSSFAGIYISPIHNTGSPGSGTVEVYNNTLYDCASSSDAAGEGGLENDGGALNKFMHARNNIVYALSGEAYVGGDHFTGSNNLFFGNGAAPTGFGFTSSINLDPKFASIGSRDFHLLSGSPAIDAGVAISGLTTDIEGTARPQGSGIDVGAYEFGSATIVRPAAPTNLKAVVH